MSDLDNLVNEFNSYIKNTLYIDDYNKWRGEHYAAVITRNPLDIISGLDDSLNDKVSQALQQAGLPEDRPKEHEDCEALAHAKLHELKRLRIVKNKIAEKRTDLVAKIKDQDRRIEESVNIVNSSTESEDVKQSVGLSVKHTISALQENVHKL